MKFLANMLYSACVTQQSVSCNFNMLQFICLEVTVYISFIRILSEVVYFYFAKLRHVNNKVLSLGKLCGCLALLVDIPSTFTLLI